MSVDAYFNAHVGSAIANLDEAHRALLRAAQCHDDEVITLVLREVVPQVAIAREMLDQLQDVRRKPIRHEIPKVSA